MIAACQKGMDDDQGKRFLELIDEQNNLQWSIVAKLSSLIDSKWDSDRLRNDLETLVADHSKITKDLNSLDDKGAL